MDSKGEISGTRPRQRQDIQNKYIIDVWNSVPLSRRITNVEQDLCDGTLVAEFIGKLVPSVIDTDDYLTVPSDGPIARKLKNWKKLNEQVFSQLGFQVPEDVIEDIVTCKQGSVQDVTSKLQLHVSRRVSQLIDTINSSDSYLGADVEAMLERSTATNNDDGSSSSSSSSMWVDVQFLHDATEQVFECRQVLKYTYVFAYYLDDGSEKELFEFLQQQLEASTEHLSEMSEAPIEKLDKTEVANYTRITENFMKKLLEGVANGLTSS